ncbi:polysaccharide biosynthesis/export family protein [Paraburkholderia aromaticivorans]|uniref:polysaccharide biosynthesis/export family protein n=1 Tax=Paraburkholderia aromaticivorans TaxID=2026199 RepID=UPI001455F5B8|nr:polysaccharide biosynthesis/export family protein [Paraburkholderia aromaticivorans]
MLAVFLTRPACRLGALVAAVTLLASGCAMAPGMRMQNAAVLPIASVGDGAPVEQLPVPVTEVTVSLLDKLKNDAGLSTDADTRVLLGHASAYTVGVGDVLQITVWDHPELAAALGAQSPANARAYDPPPGFIVDDNGRLRFPFAGTIRVEGMKIDEIQSKLAMELGKSFRDPQVTVRIASFRSKQVYVDGEVHTPGAQPINDIPTSLYDAISHAGGFSSSADQSRISLTRDGQSYSINFTDLLQHGLNPSNIALRPGDLVRVSAREDNGVFVLGEVTKPVTALPLRNGQLTLSDALSQAGSISATTADAAQLYVIRGRGKDARVFHLDAVSPVSMILANRFELQPKDIVYVDGNGLVRFSRVLSLLLPGINAGLTAGLVAK